MKGDKREAESQQRKSSCFFEPQANTPAENAPTENAPADKAPAENAPADSAPAQSVGELRG